VKSARKLFLSAIRSLPYRETDFFLHLDENTYCKFVW